MKFLALIFTIALGFGCGGSISSSDRIAKNDSTDKETTNAAAPVDSSVELSNADDDAPRITLADAKKAFDESEVVFVDTRSSVFFENEHIKGAINIPSNDFDKNYQSVPKDKKIIAYCS